MNKEQAKRIIINTLKNPFDKTNLFFLNQLL